MIKTSASPAFAAGVNRTLHRCCAARTSGGGQKRLHADDAACAGLVLHDDRTARVFGHLAGKQARQNIDQAARAIRHDDVQRRRRLGMALAEAQQQGGRQAGQYNSPTKHLSLLECRSSAVRCCIPLRRGRPRPTGMG
ncbi:hypothetical protein [Bordetella hinzii]|uniref:hypothetical protein n=1 Tax=Bordetella hinzii TaxID=103855 RepID=UPI0018AFD055|nr:hypothetical protein [Bordetella hinzii]